VQNMLLAARALGLGATLTTLYLQFQKEAEAALGLAPGVHSYALLPVATRWAGSGRFAVLRLPTGRLQRSLGPALRDRTVRARRTVISPLSSARTRIERYRPVTTQGFAPSSNSWPAVISPPALP
jgi:hypothetical protein